MPAALNQEVTVRRPVAKRMRVRMSGTGMSQSQTSPTPPAPRLKVDGTKLQLKTSEPPSSKQTGYQGNYIAQIPVNPVWPQTISGPPSVVGRVDSKMENRQVVALA